MTDYALIDEDGTVRWQGTIDPAPGGSSPISVATVNVSSVELLALLTLVDDVPTGAPKTLLPTPTGREYYVIHGVVFHYRFGTTPYAGDFSGSLSFGAPAELASPSLLFNFSGQNAGGSLNGKVLLAQTEDAYGFVAGAMFYVDDNWNAWLASGIEALPLMLSNIAGTPLTDGDGTLTVRVFYTVIDGAP